MALLISSIAVGSVMHSISTSMRLKQRSAEKSRKWEIMRSAASLVLADPRKIMSLDELNMGEDTKIRIEKRLIKETEGGELRSGNSHLVRVRLLLDSEILELSMMAPADFDAPGGELKLPTMKSAATVYDDDVFEDEERIEEAREEVARVWEETTTYSRVVSTAPSDAGGEMVAGLGGSSGRPSMSGGAPAASGSGGWADPVDESGVPGSEVENGETSDSPAPNNDPDEQGDSADSEGDASEDRQDPPISPPSGTWERVDVSDTEYHYVNLETGQVFRIWQSGPEDYMRWKKEWVN